MIDAPREDPSRVPAPPPFAWRLQVATAVGLAAALLLLYSEWRSGSFGLGTTDFDRFWFAARELRAGNDPYQLIGPGRPLAENWPLVYPLPAVLTVTPLSFLPLTLARVLFCGFGAGTFAFTAFRDGTARIPIFLNMAFLEAVFFVQSTPLLSAALFLPWVALFAPLKPNVGIPTSFSTFSRTTIVLALVSGVTLSVISWLLVPNWVAEWRAALTTAPHLMAPLVIFGGPLLLLALWAWRMPEARLLLLLACLPHSAAAYEVLPLGLTMRTRRESLAFAFLANAAVVAQVLVLPHITADTNALWSARIFNLLVYLPCLGIILARFARERRPASE